METPETTPEADQAPKDAPPKLRVGRIEIGINIVVQLIVLLAMVMMVNYLASKYFKRWNWVRGERSELSEMTRSLMGNLPKPMKAIVFFSDKTLEVNGDARSLLREYEFAARGKLSIEDVDPEENYARARELAAKYKFVNVENLIILDYDGRSIFINTTEMAEMEQRDPMAEMQAQMQGRQLPPPQMISFLGEQVLTNKILELTEPKQNKLYLINGHGEFDTNGRKIQTLLAYTRRQNLLLENLTIADIDKIPSDANMVLILGPKFDMSERDLKVLSDYWDAKGRIFVAVGKTGGKTPNLFAWLAARGVKAKDDYVLRVVDMGSAIQVQSGCVVSSTESAITSGLEGLSIELLGATQSLELDRAKETRENLKLTGLLVSPKGFWGDVDFNVGGDDAPVEDKKDHPGPLTLAVQVEKGASTDSNVKLETSRLVVVGNSDFVSDDGLRTGPLAVNVASNCINWLLNRELLIKVPPKIKKRSTLSLPVEKLNSIRLWVILYIPLVVALFGLYFLCARHGKNLLIVTAWVATAFLVIVGCWYVLLWQLGMEDARTVPRNLIIAIGTAASLAAVSIVINYYENQKRAAAKN